MKRKIIKNKVLVDKDLLEFFLFLLLVDVYSVISLKNMVLLFGLKGLVKVKNNIGIVIVCGR